jgi:hypothetical protein
MTEHQNPNIKKQGDVYVVMEPSFYVFSLRGIW